jgi:hypothetical protein
MSETARAGAASSGIQRRRSSACWRSCPVSRPMVQASRSTMASRRRAGSGGVVSREPVRSRDGRTSTAGRRPATAPAGLMSPGSPVRYYAPVAPLTLVATTAALITSWRSRGDRRMIAAADINTVAAVGLTGYLGADGQPLPVGRRGADGGAAGPLGSPLGMPVVVYERLQPTSRPARAYGRPNMGRWINVADPGQSSSCLGGSRLTVWSPRFI